MKKMFCTFCGHRVEVSDNIVIAFCPSCLEEMEEEVKEDERPAET
jgi:hypothetical protein